MDEAYVGIDVAFSKKKRLPIVICVRRGDVLEPLPLRTAKARPPVGEGNARILDRSTVGRFARATVEYLSSIQSEHRVRIRRVAIDAPSDPRSAGTARRCAETALDHRRISCITTPDVAGFETICERARSHLAAGGPESHLPGANQLWMLVGFAIFRELRPHWECLEIYPQAIASVLGCSGVHKSQAGGLDAQLRAAARYTRWPRDAMTREVSVSRELTAIGFGSRHDRLDGYLAAWVASLEPADREPFGESPNDVIWVPRAERTAGWRDEGDAV